MAASSTRVREPVRAQRTHMPPRACVAHTLTHACPHRERHSARGGEGNSLFQTHPGLGRRPFVNTKLAAAGHRSPAGHQHPLQVKQERPRLGYWQRPRPPRATCSNAYQGLARSLPAAGALLWRDISCPGRTCTRWPCIHVSLWRWQGVFPFCLGFCVCPVSQHIAFCFPRAVGAAWRRDPASTRASGQRGLGRPLIKGRLGSVSHIKNKDSDNSEVLCHTFKALKDLD